MRGIPGRDAIRKPLIPNKNYSRGKSEGMKVMRFGPCSSGSQLFGQMSLASLRFCLPGEFLSCEPCSKLTSRSICCPL
ncbi:hypothetical protein TNIN_280441 [Trichonephila inaurata madagascariensis]|uniref:Uncharacterized protein n=1 Tax=Trichonephila inaurata madagascariensis TaxID=2747483 RepID=A0A8X6YW67_9ARAC|nr:hypothetical protein TNIN_280441 [Trichonephila inaurata madagascariensis]